MRVDLASRCCHEHDGSNQDPREVLSNAATCWKLLELIVRVALVDSCALCVALWKTCSSWFERRPTKECEEEKVIVKTDSVIVRDVY